MQLSRGQKEEFYRQGFIVLPGIVPLELVEGALWAINNSLGWQGLPPDRIATYNSQSFCPELRHDPAILNLFKETPLLSVAESLTQPGRIFPVGADGQIALRFPRQRTPNYELNPHLDGMYTPLNGVPEGKILSFMALVGVFLSDIPHDEMGNLTVWPGSHHRFEAYFKEHSPAKLLEGMPPVELGQPVQIKARAGDAIMAHYQLAHAVGPNFSPYIRYATFFRLMTESHKDYGLDILTDIWKEWDGLREFVEK
jgi:hypothetical protein